MTGAAPGLVVAIGADADSAVVHMYRRHRLDMIRLARVVVGERDAQDVVQEAFVDLHQHWGRVRETDRALPYLRSCVLNRCRSRLRPQERARRREQPSPALAVPSAESSFVLAEDQRRLLARLRRLPRRQREVLVLRYWSELSESKIAATLGISRGAVRLCIPWSRRVTSRAGGAAMSVEPELTAVLSAAALGSEPGVTRPIWCAGSPGDPGRVAVVGSPGESRLWL